MTLFTFNVIKILVLAALAAGMAGVIAPFLIKFLYRIKFWKKEARTKTITGDEAEVFYSLHKEREITVPPRWGTAHLDNSLRFNLSIFFNFPVYGYLVAEEIKFPLAKGNLAASFHDRGGFHCRSLGRYFGGLRQRKIYCRRFNHQKENTGYCFNRLGLRSLVLLQTWLGFNSYSFNL